MMTKQQIEQCIRLQQRTLANRANVITVIRASMQHCKSMIVKANSYDLRLSRVRLYHHYKQLHETYTTEQQASKALLRHLYELARQP